MDLAEVIDLVTHAEKIAPFVQPLLGELDQTITALVGAILIETDQQLKSVMVALEFRARMVRQRWKRLGQN